MWHMHGQVYVGKPPCRRLTPNTVLQDSLKESAVPAPKIDASTHTQPWHGVTRTPCKHRDTTHTSKRTRQCLTTTQVTAARRRANTHTPIVNSQHTTPSTRVRMCPLRGCSMQLLPQRPPPAHTASKPLKGPAPCQLWLLYLLCCGCGCACHCLLWPRWLCCGRCCLRAHVLLWCRRWLRCRCLLWDHLCWRGCRGCVHHRGWGGQHGGQAVDLDTHACTQQFLKPVDDVLAECGGLEDLVIAAHAAQQALTLALITHLQQQ